MGMGMAFLLPASYYAGEFYFKDPLFFFKKQLLFFLLSLLLILLLLQIPTKYFFSLTWLIYFFTLFSLLLLFTPLGKKAGGATRWLSLGPFSFQPAEIARISILFLGARILSKKHTLTSYLLFIALSFPLILLILTQPDFSTAFYLSTILFILLFLGGLPIRFFIAFFLFVIPIFYLFLLKEPYRIRRIEAFLDPFSYRYEEGYQLFASFRSFLEGSLWGKGVGESLLRHPLHTRHTDFILAVVAEELGFIGALFLLLFFLFLSLYPYFWIEKHIEDKFLKLLGKGIGISFIFQVLLHYMVVVGLIPTTGISLPFFSYGGSSFLSYSFLWGVLLRIIKEKDFP